MGQKDRAVRRTGWCCLSADESIAGSGGSASAPWRASASCGKTCGSVDSWGDKLACRPGNAIVATPLDPALPIFVSPRPPSAKSHQQRRATANMNFSGQRWFRGVRTGILMVVLSNTERGLVFLFFFSRLRGKQTQNGVFLGFGALIGYLRRFAKRVPALWLVILTCGQIGGGA